MKREDFDKLEVEHQVDFINIELEKKSLTKISEEIKISRKTLRNRFEKIGYIYNKKSNKYIKKSVNKGKEGLNNTIDINVLCDKIKGLEMKIEAVEGEVEKLKEDSLDTNFNEIGIRYLEGETVSRCYRLNREVQKEFSVFCKKHSGYKIQDILGTALVEFMEKYK